MLKDKWLAARDADDALAALRLLPSRGENQRGRRDTLMGSDPMRPPAEALRTRRDPMRAIDSFTALQRDHRNDHTRSLSSLQGLTLPIKPKKLKELERRQLQAHRPRVVRDPVTGVGIPGNQGGLMSPDLKPVYYTANEVPFGAKSSAGRLSEWGEARSSPNPVAWPSETANSKRSTSSFYGPQDFTPKYVQDDALAPAPAAARRPASGPPGSHALTAESLAALKASASSGQLSNEEARKRLQKLEYRLFREHQRKSQAERELDATLATVPSYGVLDIAHMRRANSAKYLADARGAAGGLGKFTADAHLRPQKSRFFTPDDTSLGGIFAMPEDVRRGKERIG